jgi:hypothetical protein
MTSVVVHVVGPASRAPSFACAFVVRAAVREGGKQVTCLTSVVGVPAPRAVIHSKGTMTFLLRRGTIRARVSVTQRFAADGVTATQTLTGTIVGGTRAYAGARGTIRGGGTLRDSRAGLTRLRLAYRLVFD